MLFYSVFPLTGYSLARLGGGSSSAKSDANMNTQPVTDLTSPGVFQISLFTSSIELLVVLPQSPVFPE